MFTERQETSRKHKTNLCAEKRKTQKAGCHRKPLLQHESLHMTCRSFHRKHDTTLSKYPTSNPNPHTGDGCMRHYWLNDPSRLDLIPSLILNYSILIAWWSRMMCLQHLSVWEVCHQRSVLLKENCAFKTTNFTGFHGELVKETLRSHLILKIHTGISPRQQLTKGCRPIMSLTASQLVWMWWQLGSITCLLLLV